MRPGEVLDAQRDLLERLTTVPGFTAIVNALGGMSYGRSGGTKDPDIEVAPLLTQAVKTAYAYRVTHDMSMLVEHAAAGLDDLDRFDPQLAPTGAGFVAFDRPLPVADMRGKTMLIHYLVWGPALTQYGPSTAIYAFNDTWRQPDQIAQEMLTPGYQDEQGWTQEKIDAWKKASGRWATVGFSAFFKDQRLGPARLMPSADQQARLLAEGSTPAPGSSQIRLVHALWLMMNQTVARKEVEQADRPARRRAAKARLPQEVTVIRLRREQGAERAEGESLIEWTHRWLVRGHWRWQVVSPHHPLAQEIEPGKYRARIWINPFVKGPQDAPFKQTEKVYSLER